MRKKLLILTVGCKANFAGSAGIARMGLSAGFEVVRPGDPADVVVVNGCTVTHKADRDCRAVARRARRTNPGATIVMTGCYAEVTGDGGGMVPEADRWIGIRAPGVMETALRDLSGNREGLRGESSLSEHASDLLLGRRRTFLPVQDGCDAACSYCIVPRARGRSRSRPVREVVADAVRSETDGAREIVLTGIHIGRFGADRRETEGLPCLLQRLLDGTREVRFRLSSIEPLELTPRLLDVMAAAGGRVCRHLHVPLQSGSDRVLLRMRRPYGASQYRAAVEAAAERLPGVQVGADVIAGFPGERPEDFGDTMRLLESAPVHYLHPFGYSARAGTESASFADVVAEDEKKTRVRALRAIDAERRDAFRRTLIGSALDVLAETRDPSGKRLRGYSGNYVSVAFRGPEERVGSIVTVRARSVEGRRIVARMEDGLGGD